jgi:hypothetical protein
MTVVELPARGRWVGDLRGDRRAVRATAHPESGLLTISVWRDDACAGTVQLSPADVAGLVASLTACLVELTSSHATSADIGDGQDDGERA